ncbi:hypothetical protein M2350_003538 [Candidatus Fervidibacter sacchari]|jgi:hypothetical protein|uniref:Uncharacterized protein n=1 Tax=Candidatus Fervidibacter sacchari TaxID=1448929 RepID=A0ABT2ESZ7_9BACT|nr:hypothetical protein [Candidatus Fervidibacter sacchari]
MTKVASGLVLDGSYPFERLLLVAKHPQSILIPLYAAVSVPKTLKILIELDKE